jgi:hypothetical protein
MNENENRIIAAILTVAYYSCIQERHRALHVIGAESLDRCGFDPMPGLWARRVYQQTDTGGKIEIGTANSEWQSCTYGCGYLLG